MARIRALTYEGPEDIRVSTVPDPVPHDIDGAVVRVEAAGICGSDLHIYEGHGFSVDLGYCVGHEAVGEVIEVGRGVRSFAVGDRVLVPASVGCRDCAACRSGWVLGCERMQSGCYGLGHALEGSQAEAVSVPAADLNLVAIPEGIGDDAALTLTDNLPTAWYGARRARIEPGDTVAVVGLGPVGLLSVLSAQAMGAARVLAVDLVADRRAKAAALGAEPMDGDDSRAAVLEATGGQGVDVALEAVGADATITLALDIARRGGRVSVVGVNQNMAFPMRMVLAQLKELEFAIGLCSVQRELPTLLALVGSGRMHPEVVVTHHLPLSEGPEAYAMFAHRTDGVGKVTLDPPMTELLYLHDAELREFDATVTALDEEAQAVALDRTAFYPTGGGQPHDTGTLAGAPVTDVRKGRDDHADLVWHTLDGDLPAVGDTVHGVVDVERRHQLMRTHSALHVLCGVIWNEWGKPVTGGNMEPLSARMDFEFDPLPEGFGERVEELVNAEIAADRPIEVSFLPRGEAVGDADLIRTKVNMIPESVTEIHVVDIVGLDKQADGGTHVRSTGEIGRFVVVKTESKGKGNKRLRIRLEDV